MSILNLLFIILTVIALSSGQILFKLAAPSLSLNSANILISLLNFRLITALLVYGVATIMWLFVLKSMPLRVAYPFVALAFILVPLMAHLFLGEELRWNTMVGAAIISIGVWVSIYE